MNNINDFPIDNELKNLVTNLVIDDLGRIGITLTENEGLWFKNECAESLIANILEAINQWTIKKLN